MEAAFSSSNFCHHFVDDTERTSTKFTFKRKAQGLPFPPLDKTYHIAGCVRLSSELVLHNLNGKYFSLFRSCTILLPMSELTSKAIYRTGRSFGANACGYLLTQLTEALIWFYQHQDVHNEVLSQLCSTQTFSRKKERGGRKERQCKTSWKVEEEEIEKRRWGRRRGKRRRSKRLGTGAHK